MSRARQQRSRARRLAWSVGIAVLIATGPAGAQFGPSSGPSPGPPPPGAPPPGTVPAPPMGDIIDPGPPPGGGDIVNAATEELFNAVAINDFAAVQAAVAAGGDIDATDRFGLSPIDIAIDKGHYQIAHFLLSVRNFQPSGRGTAARGPVPGQPAVDPGRVPPTATRPPAAAAVAAPSPAAETVAAMPPPDPARAERFRWPETEPNPFDPAVPVFGGVLTAGAGGDQ